MSRVSPCYMLIYLLLSASLLGVRAQERHIDSIKMLLSSDLHDTSRVIIYNRLFFNYIFVDADSALRYGNHARDLARQIGYRRGEATYLNHLGVWHRIEGDYGSSVQRLMESLTINEEIEYLNGKANNYINLGLVYATQDNYSKALEYYKKCLEIKEKTKEKVGIANAWKDMGDIYAQMGDRMMAIRCYEAAVNEKAYPSITARAWLSEAKLFLDDNQLEQAQAYISKAIALLQIHDKFTLSAALNIEGQIWVRQKRYEAALQNFQKALYFSQQYRNISEETNACLNLAKNYHQLGNHTKAYEFAMHCNVLADSIHQTEKAERMLRLQNSFEIRQREAQVRTLQQQQRLHEAEMERKKTQSRWMGIVLILAGGLLLVFWRLLALQRRARLADAAQRDELSRINAELEQKNDAIQHFNHSLERKIAERTAELSRTVGDLRAYNQDLQQFSHIVSHNLRAPIASILGLISLLESEIAKTNEETQSFLKYLGVSANRLDEIIRELNNILNTSTVGKNREMVFLKEVVTSVLLQLQDEIDTKKAIISINFEQGPALYSVRGYIESILYNIISNSLKFQKENITPIINIKSCLDGSSLCISIQDNGRGIDFEHQSLEELMNQRASDTTGTVRGIGLYLIHIQTEALGGSVTINSVPSEGTLFKVCLPES